MELRLYLRVLARHRRVIYIGLVLAVVLSVLSYYRIDAQGVVPSLKPRKAELWQSQANLFITEGGFPAGSRVRSDSAGRFAGLALIYARLAQSDQVRQQIERDRPLPGLFQAIPIVDATAGNIALPMVALFGKAGTPEAAKATVTRGLEGFVSYMQASQVAARIPKSRRIQLSVINAPQPAILIEPRKKTLPIVVFLAVMIAAIAVAFVVENASRSRAGAFVEVLPDLRLQEPEAGPEPEPQREPRPAAAPELRTERELEPEPEPEITRVRRWA